MPLKLDGEGSSIFNHNRDFSEGVKERGIRPGLATVVVALDGSGDAESIQEGIDMLPADGGAVYIKEGSYEITETILVPSYAKIQGVGRNTIIYQSTGVNAPEVFIKNKDHATSNKQIILTDFSLKCITTYGGTSYGIELINCTNSTIKNLYLVEGTNHGVNPVIILTGCDLNMIQSCQLRNTYTNDGTEGAITLNNSEYNQIINNLFGENSTIGIVMDADSHHNIIGENTININSGNVGVRVKGDENIITGNIVSGVSEEFAVEITATGDRNLIVGNIIYPNTGGNLDNSGSNTTATGNITA